MYKDGMSRSSVITVCMGPNCDQPTEEAADHSVISLIVSARVKWSLQSAE